MLNHVCYLGQFYAQMWKCLHFPQALNFIRDIDCMPEASLLWFLHTSSHAFNSWCTFSCRPLMKPLQSWIHWMKTHTKTAHLSCSCFEITSQWVSNRAILAYKRLLTTLKIEHLCLTYQCSSMPPFLIFPISYGPLTTPQMRAKVEMEEKTKPNSLHILKKNNPGKTTTFYTSSFLIVSLMIILAM